MLKFQLYIDWIITIHSLVIGLALIAVSLIYQLEFLSLGLFILAGAVAFYPKFKIPQFIKIVVGSLILVLTIS